MNRSGQDALGRALLDHLEGNDGPPLLLESDDGDVRTADLQPADFFLPVDAGPRWERDALDAATGAILDLGAGAGRHAVHFRSMGHPVTAVDVSPGAVAVCRTRGVADVRELDLRDPPDGSWDTVLLMGGNLGLAGDWQPTRNLLGRLASMVPVGGVLIGDSVDPTSDDPEYLAYEARNDAAGFHRGHVRLRLRYGDLVGAWWDQLNIAPSDLDHLVDRTGWTLEGRFDDPEGYSVVLRRS
jgi:SAM-dependent methyltransferase